MLSSAERRHQILHTLQTQDSVRVTRLAQRFGVSAVTIRTDLRTLTAAGLLARQHGSAHLPGLPPQETPLADKRNLHRDRKRRIAAVAARLVAPGDKLILDAGSTTHFLARLLGGLAPLSVFTNSLPVANALAEAPGVELILAGGSLRKVSQSLQGLLAEASLEPFVFDKLFLGADGCDLAFGLSTHDAGEARLNARMAERAREVILLADGSKFGQLCLHHICPLQQVHTVVSDASLPPAWRAALAARGIRVLIAEEEEHEA